MSRRAGLAAALVAIVAVVIWFATRDPRRTSPDASGQPAAPTARVEPSPSRAPAVTPAPAVDPDDPAPVIDATHVQVHTIGRACWDGRTRHTFAPGEPDDTVGRMELRLHVVVAAGEARVDAAEIVSTRRLTDELRDCIVAGVTGAAWPLAGAPDGEVEIVELFRMGDYLLRGPQDGPPPLPQRPPPR